MSSSYTKCVADGSVDKLSDFALKCAGVPLTDGHVEALTVSDFYREKLSDSRKELAKIESMSYSECTLKATEEFHTKSLERKDRISRNNEQRARYEDMLLQVEAWIIPDDSLKLLKDFMLDQLKSSMSFDCSTSLPAPVAQQTGKEWRENWISFLKAEIIRYIELLNREVVRIAGANAYTRVLLKSLNLDAEVK